MIRVTLLNGSVRVVNSELIELIEQTPDTIISLSNGKKIMVREPIGKVVERVIAFRRATARAASRVARRRRVCC